MALLDSGPVGVCCAVDEQQVEDLPVFFKPTGGVLSDTEIRTEMLQGRIAIDPFKPENLSSCSYDVTLGCNFYTTRGTEVATFDPWDEQSVRKYWCTPLTLADGENLRLSPGETVLAHTQEVVGARGNITMMMKARSSLGRCCVAVCKCAGWGDVGYVNKWTMEITNMGQTSVLLPVGKRVAQIIFMYTGKVSSGYGGKYNAAPGGVTWSPEEMLPKLWKERK